MDKILCELKGADAGGKRGEGGPHLKTGRAGGTVSPSPLSFLFF